MEVYLNLYFGSDPNRYKLKYTAQHSYVFPLIDATDFGNNPTQYKANAGFRFC
jgi:hypothetical protein